MCRGDIRCPGVHAAGVLGSGRVRTELEIARPPRRQQPCRWHSVGQALFLCLRPIVDDHFVGGWLIGDGERRRPPVWARPGGHETLTPLGHRRREILTPVTPPAVRNRRPAVAGNSARPMPRAPAGWSAFWKTPTRVRAPLQTQGLSSPSPAAAIRRSALASSITKTKSPPPQVRHGAEDVSKLATCRNDPAFCLFAIRLA